MLLKLMNFTEYCNLFLIYVSMDKETFIVRLNDIIKRKNK